MLQKPFIAANDGSYLARFCPIVHQAIGTNRVISTAKGVTTPGIRLFVDRVQAPCPAYSIPLFRTHLRKEFLMYPKEKAAAAAAASMPINGQNRVHTYPTTNRFGRQDFQNIFSNKGLVFNHQITIKNILST